MNNQAVEIQSGDVFETFGRAVADLVRGAVAEAIATQRVAAERAPAQSRMVDLHELCAALAISESTARRMVAEGCPVEYFGASQRFDVAAVRTWARERGKRAVSKPSKRSCRAGLPEGVTLKAPRSRRS